MGACCPSLRRVGADAGLQLPGVPCLTAQYLPQVLQACFYGLTGSGVCSVHGVQHCLPEAAHSWPP